MGWLGVIAAAAMLVFANWSEISEVVAKLTKNLRPGVKPTPAGVSDEVILIALIRIKEQLKSQATVNVTAIDAVEKAMTAVVGGEA